MEPSTQTEERRYPIFDRLLARPQAPAVTIATVKKTVRAASAKDGLAAVRAGATMLLRYASSPACVQSPPNSSSYAKVLLEAADLARQSGSSECQRTVSETAPDLLVKHVVTCLARGQWDAYTQALDALARFDAEKPVDGTDAGAPGRARQRWMELTSTLLEHARSTLDPSTMKDTLVELMTPEDMRSTELPIGEYQDRFRAFHYRLETGMWALPWTWWCAARVDDLDESNRGDTPTPTPQNAPASPAPAVAERASEEIVTVLKDLIEAFTTGIERFAHAVLAAGDEPPASPSTPGLRPRGQRNRATVLGRSAPLAKRLSKLINDCTQPYQELAGRVEPMLERLRETADKWTKESADS